jgi:L-lactate dehydrogenase complex protein LldG
MAIDDNRTSREATLSRVRAALGRHGPDDVARAAAHAYIAARGQGPRPALPADLARHFLTRATDMSSTVERVATQSDVVAAVGRYVESLMGASADASQDPRAGVCWPEFAALGWSEAGVSIESRPTLGHDAIGITGCYCAIAETGTLVFVTGTGTPTATFLLPETHVAIVRVDQIVPAMEDAFARIRAEFGALPRAVNLVSGPSRTGDIEQTIVLGAHGPRRMHVVLVG